MARTSAADLAHGLEGATFPMSTRQLAEHARQNRAPDEVVQTIKRMPDKEFDSLADVEHAFSESQEDEPAEGGTAATKKGGSQRRPH
jgi:Protein of unknown function (DUF2795)